VNTLPIRTDLSGDPAISELLGRVREVALEVYSNQDIPFEKLVEKLAPERDLRFAPIFHVAFGMQNVPKARPQLPGISLDLLGDHLKTSKYDLVLSISELDAALNVEFTYNTDLFENLTIKKMLDHFVRIIELIAANPEQRLSEFSLLTDRERYYFSVDWNNTNEQFPSDYCVHQLFEQQAKATPMSPAVRNKEAQISYRQLDRRANQLAHHLKAIGVTPGATVGICMRHGAETIIAILGILKAGAAFVPIDSAYPIARIQYMIRSAKLTVLLTQQSISESLDISEIPMLRLDTQMDAIGNCEEDELTTDVTPEDLAYIIYTSGSTGEPKGVKISHRALVNYIWWAKKEYLREQRADMPLYTSLSFDLTITSVFAPLISGNTVVIYRQAQDQVPLFDLLDDNQVDVVKLTPSHLKIIKERDNSKSRIKRLIVGGEALETRLTMEICKSFGGGVEIYNEYGPTEATVGCMTHRYEKGNDLRPFVPIGRPVANTQIYILNDKLKPVEENTVGELYISGVGLASGYLNGAEINSEKFLDNPFKIGERLYRTGDLARRLCNGEIEYLGRRDQQVKYHGHRVELEEIRSAVNSHPQIRDSIIQVRKDDSGNEVMVCYYLSRHEINSEEIVLELKKWLVVEVIPNLFVRLGKIPLTLNGKINYEMLPGIEEARGSVTKKYAPPRNETESILVKIWEKILQVNNIGITDNFFQLGGDSILSIMVVARANQAGLSLLLKDMFAHQTIAELANIAKPLWTIKSSQEPISGDLPLTPVQCWFFEQDFLDPHHYNQAVMFDSSRRLDPVRMRRAVGEIFKHHDALRLRFAREAGVWRQRIEPVDKFFSFTCVDLSLLQEDDDGVIDSIIEKLNQSLNLSEGPLVRVAVIHTGGHRSDSLLIIIHHLLVDGVSWRILLEDLQSAYVQLSDGTHVELAGKTSTLKTWAESLVTYADSEKMIKEAEYWLSFLNRQPGALPISFSSGENDVASSRWIAAALDETDTHALLHDVPGAYRAQIQHVMVAALARTFAAKLDGGFLLVDLEGHGREPLFDSVDLSRTVGFFTSFYPVMLDLSISRSMREAVKSSKEMLRRIPNNGIGYGILRYLAKQDIRDRMSTLPRADVSFNYLGQFDQTLSKNDQFSLSNRSLGSLISKRSRRHYLLEIVCYVIGNRLQVIWNYSENRHGQAEIEALAEGYLASLREALTYSASAGANCYTPSDFPLINLSQQQLDALTTRYPEIEDIYPLSPLQQGLLFHTVYSPYSGMYMGQMSCRISGSLNVKAYRQAWQRVLDHNPALRPAIVWELLNEPLQIVYHQTTLPWEQMDWRGIPENEQEESFNSFMIADRARDFDFAKGPLLRFALVQLADDLYQFLWSFHHLILDGWCLSLIFKQVLHSYRSFNEGLDPVIEKAPLYRDYIAWIKQQDRRLAQDYWRGMLNGVGSPTPLFPTKVVGGKKMASEFNDIVIRLSEERTESLKSYCRDNYITMNTLMQGVWALILGHYGGSRDIVYGTTISGRPPEIEGVESMIGFLINTIPARIKIDPEALLPDWLKEIQAQQAETRQYGYASLIDIQSWIGWPRNIPLFESIFIFENFPFDQSVYEELDNNLGVEIHKYELYDRTNYPIVCSSAVGGIMPIGIKYDSSLFSSETVDEILEDIDNLLRVIALDQSLRLKDLEVSLVNSDSERRERERSRRDNFKRAQLKQIQPKLLPIDEQTDAEGVKNTYSKA
jgi:amino acid adenylation domain-containing protein/non-ribosomal peptide synthase protein (TIGR01720 family)